MGHITKRKVLKWLGEVMDPEIPVLSLLDLGVITQVEVDEKQRVLVEMTPTFTGCPAMDHMVNEVKEVLAKNGVDHFEVNVTLEKAWSTNNITANGRKALKEFGLAPPHRYDVIVDLNIIQQALCPHCDSSDTEMKSPFGPTLCRSLHYCNSCKQAFEQFKPL